MNMEKKVYYYNPVDDIWQDTLCSQDELEYRLNKIKIYDTRFSYVYLPMSWSIEVITDNILELILHTSRITLENGIITENVNKEWTIDCDINQGIVQGWPASLVNNTERNWRNAYVCGANTAFPELLAARYVDIPADVIDVAINYLQDIVKIKFGFRPSFLGNAHGLSHMIAFCESPLDPNIFILKEVLGKEAYRHILEQGRCDCFKSLCEYFKIKKPPPSLRKAYIVNPESFLVYVYLRQCGFHDINIIRRFFYREEVFGYKLLDFRYHALTNMFTLKGIGNYDLANFQRFCLWLLRYRSEKAIASRVLRWCNERFTTAASDTLRMFAEAQLDVDEEQIDYITRRKLLNEGLTNEVHDMLVDNIFITHPEAINPHIRTKNGQYINIKFEYSEKTLNLESTMGDYHIILPKDSNELRKWGNVFHNCVASYISAVAHKSSIILAMKKQEKYIACIEIQQNRIIQALGYCNQNLSIEYRRIIGGWSVLNKIFYRNNPIE